MFRSLMMLGALAATTTTVFAQQPAAPQPPARGVEMALAVEAAQAAVNQCLSEGVKGAAAVLDSAGVTRVLISADGASANASVLGPKKGVATIREKKASSEIQAAADKDPALKAKLEADKDIFPRAGALPIMVGSDMVGAIAFGGANGQQGGGTHDEACAKAGLTKIQARVK
jgi:uncharacterized protein GlcG (DUF336 family)